MNKEWKEGMEHWRNKTGCADVRHHDGDSWRAVLLLGKVFFNLWALTYPSCPKKKMRILVIFSAYLAEPHESMQARKSLVYPSKTLCIYILCSRWCCVSGYWFPWASLWMASSERIMPLCPMDTRSLALVNEGEAEPLSLYQPCLLFNLFHSR